MNEYLCPHCGGSVVMVVAEEVVERDQALFEAFGEDAWNMIPPDIVKWRRRQREMAAYKQWKENEE